jgi:hypothetical protein
VQVLPGAIEVAPEGEADAEGFGQRGGRELREGVARGFGVDLVLHDDVGTEGLAVLRDEMRLERGGEGGVQRGEGVGVEEDGDASTDGAQSGLGEPESRGRGGGFAKELRGSLVVGKLVKEAEVGGDEIALGRKEAAAQVLVEALGGFVELEGQDEGLDERGSCGCAESYVEDGVDSRSVVAC